MQMERNVDRLLRSLVGVLDYAATWSENRRLRRLDILKDAAIEEHQLIRNVVSGLGAGCGIRLERSAVRVFACQKMFESLPQNDEPVAGTHGRGSAPRVQRPGVQGHRSDTTAPPSAVRHVAEAHGGNGNGHHPPAVTRRAEDGPPSSPSAAAGTELPAPMVSRPAGAARPAFQVIDADATASAQSSREVREVREGSGARPVRVVRAPEGLGPIRLDQLELENRGVMLRCRVVLSAGEQVYSAIAEAPGGGTAEAELAASVTLDALRAGCLTTARMEGVGFTVINGRTYIVAALREPGSADVRAGSAPVQESVGRAAVSAMLAAVGPVAAQNQEPASLRLG